MTPDWLKSFEARIGIEGRNVVIVAALLFNAFVLWESLKTYADHPALSMVLLWTAVIFAVAIVSVALLAKPRPSEVTSRHFMQQIGNQFVLAGGLQSQEEILAILREAHHIKDLPPPSGIVRGSASDPSNYQPISPEDAAAIASSDKQNVGRLLREEAARIIAAAIPAAPGQPILDTKSKPALGPKAASEGKKQG